MAQRGDAGVEPLKDVGRPADCAGGQFRFGLGQRVGLGERSCRAVRLWAAPDTLGPDEADGFPESGNIMQADPPAAVADSHDSAGRAAVQDLVGFNVQQQAVAGADNGGEVDAVDIEEGVRAGTPVPVRAGSTMEHVRVSEELVAWSLSIQRGPDLFPVARHAAPIKQRRIPSYSNP